eukprot:Rmarinus@m.25785
MADGEADEDAVQQKLMDFYLQTLQTPAGFSEESSSPYEGALQPDSATVPPLEEAVAVRSFRSPKKAEINPFYSFRGDAPPETLPRVSPKPQHVPDPSMSLSSGQAKILEPSRVPIDPLDPVRLSSSMRVPRPKKPKREAVMEKRDRQATEARRASIADDSYLAAIDGARASVQGQKFSSRHATQNSAFREMISTIMPGTADFADTSEFTGWTSVQTNRSTNWGGRADARAPKQSGKKEAKQRRSTHPRPQPELPAVSQRAPSPPAPLESSSEPTVPPSASHDLPGSSPQTPSHLKRTQSPPSSQHPEGTCAQEHVPPQTGTSEDVVSDVSRPSSSKPPISPAPTRTAPLASTNTSGLSTTPPPIGASLVSTPPPAISSRSGTPPSPAPEAEFLPPVSAFDRHHKSLEFELQATGLMDTASTGGFARFLGTSSPSDSGLDDVPQRDVPSLASASKAGKKRVHRAKSSSPSPTKPNVTRLTSSMLSAKSFSKSLPQIGDSLLVHGQGVASDDEELMAELREKDAPRPVPKRRLKPVEAQVNRAASCPPQDTLDANENLAKGVQRMAARLNVPPERLLRTMPSLSSSLFRSPDRLAAKLAGAQMALSMSAKFGPAGDEENSSGVASVLGQVDDGPLGSQMPLFMERDKLMDSYRRLPTLAPGGSATYSGDRPSSSSLAAAAELKLNEGSPEKSLSFSSRSPNARGHGRVSDRLRALSSLGIADTSTLSLGVSMREAQARQQQLADGVRVQTISEEQLGTSSALGASQKLKHLRHGVKGVSARDNQDMSTSDQMLSSSLPANAFAQFVQQTKAQELNAVASPAATVKGYSRKGLAVGHDGAATDRIIIDALLVDINTFDPQITQMFASGLPPSRIPKKFHVYDGVKPPVGENKSYTQLFPSDKPTSREEVSFLRSTLAGMMQNTDFKITSFKLGRYDPSDDSFMRNLRKETAVWDIIFSELIRQVAATCSDRAMLLEWIRRRFLFNLERALTACMMKRVRPNDRMKAVVTGTGRSSRRSARYSHRGSRRNLLGPRVVRSMEGLEEEGEEEISTRVLRPRVSSTDSMSEMALQKVDSTDSQLPTVQESNQEESSKTCQSQDEGSTQPAVEGTLANVAMLGNAAASQGDSGG